MAAVFAAWDRKYERRVALKVLRPDVASSIGSDRFVAETRIVGNLARPHILPLFEADEAGGLFYFSMPFAPGQSLRDRLAERGRLPLREALRITREVGEALSFAHQRGVVHRDIKPANILLLDGHAAVADFGVASLADAVGRANSEAPGMLIGSPAFMSPEQVTRSASVDHRSDQYSLACVLYEMLVGMRPIGGRDSQEIMLAKLTAAPPPLGASGRAVPRPVEVAVARALSRSPGDRYPSVAEFVRALGIPLEEDAARPYLYLRALWRARRLMILAMVGFLAWVTAWVVRSPSGFLGPSLLPTHIQPLTHGAEVEIQPALSPDGSTLAYTVLSGSLPMQIFLQDLAGGAPERLPVPPGSGPWFLPRWTADGQELVVSSRIGTSSLIVPRRGGPGRPGPPGQVWAARGDRYVYVRTGRGGADWLVVGGESGEEEQVVATGVLLHSAAWSPDGRWIAYVEGNREVVGTLGNVAPSRLWAADLERGSTRVVAEGGTNGSPAWLPGSRDLLFLSDRDGPRDLYRLSLDEKGTPVGEAEHITSGLDVHSFALSRDGSRLAYSQLSTRRNLYVLPIPRSGVATLSQAKPLTSGRQVVENRGVSPDGRWVAYDSNLAGNQEIYLIPAEGGEPVRLTEHGTHDFAPQFSPDGTEIAWISTRHGTRDIFVMNADATGKTRLSALDPGEEYFPAFSPDGLRMVFGVWGGPAGHELYEVHRGSRGGAWSSPRPLGLHGLRASWSPDGRTLAYDRTPTGGINLATDGVERVFVDTLTSELRGFRRPTWSPDGLSIYFCAVDNVGWGIFEGRVEDGTLRALVRKESDSETLLTYECAEVADGQFFLSLGEHDSDLYLMDLVRR
jgi:serine/threonine-protein kinase